MILGSVLLWLSAEQQHSIRFHPDKLQSFGKKRSRKTIRRLVDLDGTLYEYEYNLIVGIALSVFVGFFSSLLGIGGGFIHVPTMARMLDFPVHIATATSQFVLVITALTGTVVHLAQGALVHGLRRTALLGIGVIVGAQVGAWISARVGGKMIIRGLAAGLAGVGLRLILAEF
jgi:uncharacterized membrane protein YfcA